MKGRRVRNRKVWQKTGGYCWYCGALLREVWLAKPPNDGRSEFTLDHVVPVHHGGKSTIDNLVPCCRACNSAKRNRLLEEFRHYKTEQQRGRGVKFTYEQIEYLAQHGITLPRIRRWQFWFERQPTEKP